MQTANRDEETQQMGRLTYNIRESPTYKCGQTDIGARKTS